MSRSNPGIGCLDLSFPVPCALDPSAQVALEDYARVLASAAAAEVAETGPGLVGGVHLCGVTGGLATSAERDISEFARELAAATPGGGLGWS
jgi:hypothetical protein